MTSPIDNNSLASKASGACLFCKKRKRKCSGGYPCDLCATRNVECIYDHNLDRRKRASQRKERAAAASQKAALLELVKLIRFGRDDDVRSYIRTGASMEAIATWLGADKDDQSARHDGGISIDGVNSSSGQIEDVSQAMQLNRRKSGDISGDGSASVSASASGPDDGDSITTAAEEKPLSSLSQVPIHNDLRDRYRVQCTVSHEGVDASNIALFGILPFDDPQNAQTSRWQPPYRQMARLRLPKYLIQPLLLDEERCPMGAVYTDFRDFGRNRISQGVPVEEVLGEERVVVGLYFRNRRDTDGHTPSTWACEYLKLIQDTDVYVGLALIYMYACFMRWAILPTPDTYALLPVAMRPTALQRFIPHHPGVDLPVFPEMRDGLIFDMRDYIVAQQTLGSTVNWPHGLDTALDVDIETGCVTISRAFASHVSDLNNWTVSKLFADVFPELKGIYDISDQPVIKMSREGIDDFLAQHPSFVHGR